MTKFVECRVIDSKPTDRPRRAIQVAEVTRRNKPKAGIPKFVADLYSRLDPTGPQLDAVA